MIRKSESRLFHLLVFAAVLSPLLASAQSEPLNVFIDCNSCDQNYLRTKMNYVNHVRNIQDADVYILVNRTWGSASQIFDFSYTGRNDLSDITNRFEYSISNAYTSDERRSIMKSVLEKGLTAYLLHTDVIENMNLEVSAPEAGSSNQETIDDPWNNWVFDMWGQYNQEYQSLRRKHDLRTGFRADYVTKEWRIRSNIRYETSRLKLIEDSSSVTSDTERKDVFANAVKSMGSHWSSGLFTGWNSSTFDNIRRRIYIGPAIEYSLFPYQDVLQKEITLAYRIGLNDQNYFQETIFETLSDQYFNHSLSLIVRYRRPWGTLSTFLSGSQVLQDTERNRIQFNNYANIRLFKGFSLRLSADMELIKDQISLPKGETSLEDLLLQQTAVASNFDMRLGVGFNYTFGSIYNNVLNTRL